MARPPDVPVIGRITDVRHHVERETVRGVGGAVRGYTEPRGTVEVTIEVDAHQADEFAELSRRMGAVVLSPLPRPLTDAQREGLTRPLAEADLVRGFALRDRARQAEREGTPVMTERALHAFHAEMNTPPPSPLAPLSAELRAAVVERAIETINFSLRPSATLWDRLLQEDA